MSATVYILVIFRFQMSLRHWCELGVEAPLVIQLFAGGLHGGLELTCTEVLPPLELDIDHLPRSGLR